MTFARVLREGDARAAAALVGGEYWNDLFTEDDLARAFERSQAVVIGHTEDGALVACARAVSDDTKHAWIYDVGVAPALRRTGVGQEMIALLLDHPRVRDAAFVHLKTRDAQTFYERFGFTDKEVIARPYTSTTMTLVRSERLSLGRHPARSPRA
ncbi:MAG: GNAT family N-acetyltransferase [Polyangiaceae bacterium]